MPPKKIFFILLIILGLMGVAGAGYWHAVVKKPNVVLTPSPSPTPTPPPPDTPPTAGTTLDISSVSITPKRSGAIVSWQTTLKATAVLNYGLNQNNLSETKAIPSLSARQTLSLTGLKAQSKYYYRLESKSADGQIASASGGFITR